MAKMIVVTVKGVPEELKTKYLSDLIRKTLVGMGIASENVYCNFSNDLMPRCGKGIFFKYEATTEALATMGLDWKEIAHMNVSSVAKNYFPHYWIERIE